MKKYVHDIQNAVEDPEIAANGEDRGKQIGSSASFAKKHRGKF